MTMSEEINADGTVETPKVDENIDWEARAKKAEAKIVDMKKSTKQEEPKVETPVTPETPKNTDSNPYEIAKKVIAEEKFFEANADLAEYKEEFSKLTSGGLTYEEAKEVVIKRNPDIVERQKTKNSNFTAGTADANTNEYTQEQIAEMPMTDRIKVYAKARKGDITITA